MKIHKEIEDEDNSERWKNVRGGGAQKSVTKDEIGIKGSVERRRWLQRRQKKIKNKETVYRNEIIKRLWRKK